MQLEQITAGRRPGWGLVRFLRAKDGATALEFALIAAPLFFSLLATMEIALVMLKGELLQKAVEKAARPIYTGEFQTDGTNTTLSNTELQSKVKAIVCAEVSAMISCDGTNGLAIDLRQVASFSGASAPNPVNGQKKYDTSSYGYGKVSATQIGVLTASFEYKTFFPPLTGGNLANGNRVIVATSVFKVEPYAAN